MIYNLEAGLQANCSRDSRERGAGLAWLAMLGGATAAGSWGPRPALAASVREPFGLVGAGDLALGEEEGDEGTTGPWIQLIFICRHQPKRPCSHLKENPGLWTSAPVHTY
jgi:hypothetical protein